MDCGLVKLINGTVCACKNIGIAKVACYIFLMYIAVAYLRLVFKRQSRLKAFPSRKVWLLNPIGNGMDFFTMARDRGIMLSVYILQLCMAYQELFKDKSFYFFTSTRLPFIVVTKAKAAEEFIATSKNSVKLWVYDWLHPWLRTGLLTSSGSKWKSRRRLLTPSFHFDILKDFLPVFNEQSQLLVELLEKETEQPWTDIVKPITLCSLDIICETVLGVKVGAQSNADSEYVQAVARVSDVVLNRFIFLPYHCDWLFYQSRPGIEFMEDVKLLHNFTLKTIADRKEKLLCRNVAKNDSNKKRKAFLDLLLENGGEISDEGIREEVDTFAFEGHDTTSTAISMSLYLIGLYKDVQDNLHEEIDGIFGEVRERPVTVEDIKEMEYLDRVVKESLRLYPPVPIIAREITEDVTVCGTKVPKGFGLVIFTYGIHRDESTFPKPEKFDPDRFLPENSAKRNAFAYIPFSAGPRNCIGQRFAIMEIKVVLTNILKHYNIESLDARDKVLVAPELVLRTATPIRVKFRPRKQL